MRKEFIRGPRPLELMVAQESHGPPCAPREAGSVGSEDEGSPLTLDVGKGVEHFGSHFWVKSRGRFV